MRNKIVAMGLTIAVLFAGGCGKAGLGEECDEEGGEGECESGAICGNPDDSDDGDGLECLKSCEDHADCAAGEECNGVSHTSLKGCQLKKK